MWDLNNCGLQGLKPQRRRQEKNAPLQCTNSLNCPCHEVNAAIPSLLVTDDLLLKVTYVSFMEGVVVVCHSFASIFSIRLVRAGLLTDLGSF